MADFKTPLAVVVAYDRNFNDGHSVYEDLYHLLCRNAKNHLLMVWIYLYFTRQIKKMVKLPMFVQI